MLDSARGLGAGAARPRIRTADYTDAAGNFQIEALHSVAHLMTVSVGDTTGRYHPVLYRVYRDTLRFSAGRPLRHIASLEPIGPCHVW